MDGYFTLIEHPISEYLFWWTQSLLLVAAGVGAWIAYFQLRTLGDQAKATLLLELDRRYEGPELTASRKLVNEIRDNAVDVVGRKNPRAADGARMKAVKRTCAKAIADLRKSDLEKYTKVMSFMGFFETVGVMVEWDYIELNEIDELFRGPILGIDVIFREHVASRERETGVPAGLYKHALKLADRIRSLSEVR